MIPHDLEMKEVVCRRPMSVLDVRFLNHQEDITLQHKLSLIETRYRYILRALGQEKASLMRDHRKLLLLKVCEPRATINKTMKEISETKKARMAHAASFSDNRRLYSSKSLSNNSVKGKIVSHCETLHSNVIVETPQTAEDEARGTLIQSLRTQSAQPKTIHSAKRRETQARAVQSAKLRETESRAGMFSIMQLRQISTIDCISEKELARQQKLAMEEKERLQKCQRDALSQKIDTFLKTLDNTCQQLENKTNP